MPKAVAAEIKNDNKLKAKANVMSISDVSTQKRAFVSIIAAQVLSEYLKEQEIEITYENNDYLNLLLFKNFNTIHITTGNNVKIAVRTYVDNDCERIFIPRSYFNSDIQADIYVAIRIEPEINTAELAGFMQAKDINNRKGNSDYIPLEINELKPVDELKQVVSTLNRSKNEHSSTEQQKVRELYFKYLENRISSKDKEFFSQHIALCAECSKEFSEILKIDSILKNNRKKLIEEEDYMLRLFANDPLLISDEVNLDEKLSDIQELITESAEVLEQGIEEALAVTESELLENNLDISAISEMSDELGYEIADEAVLFEEANTEITDTATNFDDYEIDLESEYAELVPETDIGISEEIISDFEEAVDYAQLDNLDLEELNSAEIVDEISFSEDISALSEDFSLNDLESPQENNNFNDIEPINVLSEKEEIFIEELPLLEETISSDEPFEFENMKKFDDINPEQAEETNIQYINSSEIDEQSPLIIDSLDDKAMIVDFDDIEVGDPFDISDFETFEDATFDSDIQVSAEQNSFSDNINLSADEDNSISEINSFYEEKTSVPEEYQGMSFESNTSESQEEHNYSEYEEEPVVISKSKKRNKMLIPGIAVAGVAAAIGIALWLQNRPQELPDPLANMLPPSSTANMAESHSASAPEEKTPPSVNPAVPPVNKVPQAPSVPAPVKKEEVSPIKPPSAKNINAAVQNAYSRKTYEVNVKGLSWEVNYEMAQIDVFRTYLLVVGQVLKGSLTRALAVSDEAAINNKMKIKIALGTDGLIKETNVIETSGSDLVDKTCLNILKTNLEYTHLPKMDINSDKITAVLIINF